MDVVPRDQITIQVRTLQIIVFALVMGCLLFVPVAMFVSQQAQPAEPVEGENTFPIVTAMALAFGAVALIAQLAIVPVLRKQARQKLAQEAESSDGGLAQLLISLQTSTIVGAAFSEGACFFNLIAYMLEGVPYSLLMAGILVLTILMRFPTVNGVIDWLEREMRLVREEREFGRR